jgi:hypothetical protein
MAKSIRGQLSMFNPTTCEGSSNVTSSPASEDGATPCGSPDGQTIAPCGLEVVPVSRGAWREKAKVPTIRAIFGRRGSGSSQSAALQRSLESNLRASTACTGSILFTPTWKRRTTPSGRSILAARATARRTSGLACGSWPTPRTSDGNGAGMHGSGGMDLRTTARLAGWATPIVNDATGSQYAYQGGDHSKPVLKLPGEAQSAGWPTPMREDSESTGMRPATEARPQSHTLTSAARLSGWHTPVVMDLRNSHGDGSNPRDLPRQAALVESGPTATGSTADPNHGIRKAVTGRLNPEHSRWLQGYPAAFSSCADTATASSPRSRPK